MDRYRQESMWWEAYLGSLQGRRACPESSPESSIEQDADEALAAYEKRWLEEEVSDGNV